MLGLPKVGQSPMDSLIHDLQHLHQTNFLHPGGNGSPSWPLSWVPEKFPQIPRGPLGGDRRHRGELGH